MFDLKQFKEQLLCIGTEHTLIINNITYKLKVSKMLVLCKWSCDQTNHASQKMFSNANTIDDLASYITMVTNQMLTDGGKFMHHHNTLEELTTLLPDELEGATA